MSKNNLLKLTPRTNASKLHMQMGELLATSSLLANRRYYQEYPVNRICPYFDSGRERFDWVIMDWQVVIEMHGQQHYEPVRFGGVSQEEAELLFKLRVKKDEDKQLAAESVGWKYIVFRYDENVTVQSLLDKIQNYKPLRQQAFEEQEPIRKPQKPRMTDEQKRRAREYRKQQYRRAKAWKQQNQRQR
jgi:hypothetical protein